MILLNELETAGGIVRERDPHDRRRHLVSITDAGREAVVHAQAARGTVEDEILGPLSDDERETLHRLVARALGDPPA